MRQFIAGMVLGLVMSASAGFAAQTFSHNGLFWDKLDKSAKSGYVNGYSDAMQVSIGKLDGLLIAGNLFHWKGARKIIRQAASELSAREFTSDEAVKQLDALYSNRQY